MAESSNKNPEKVINIQLTPASKLLYSASSLSDPEFNPTGKGRVDITDKGFEITVRNTETKAAGNLFLKPSGLINFHCSKPIVGKIINVTNIFLLVAGATHDDDTVTIFHLDGSNKLTFILGSDPDEEYNVELLEMDAEIENIPDIKFFCEAVLTYEILMKMIKRLEETGMSQQVLVNISERLVTFSIGEKSWLFKYGRQKAVGTRGMAPGQRHRAWFIMPHLQAMKEASSVAPCLLVCFLSEPADNVMMRFCLRELGDLVFIYKAERIDTNCQEEKGSGSEEKGSGSHEEKESGSEEKGSGSHEEKALQPEQAKILGFRFRQSDNI